jgi:Xaa-Pro aminopeptidase
MQQMKPGTLAVFFSNDIVVQNGDANYKFVQNSNTYYLTGIDQAETILVLFPDAPKPEWREILLILESHPEIQLWEGWKYSPSEAYEACSIFISRSAFA